MVIDWSDLPEDICSLISKCLTSIKDYVCFGAVCRKWHSIAIINRHHLPRQLPFLMIPGPNKNSQTRKIYSLSERRILASHLPVPHKKRCRGSIDGWLFTVDDENLSVDLFNPFPTTGNVIQLPPLTTFPGPIREIRHFKNFIHKAVLSSNPTLATDYVVMVIYGKDFKLAFFRPGNDTWTTVECQGHRYLYDDIICYCGQFYAVDCHGEVVVCDVDPCPMVTEIAAKPISDYIWRKRYLVESSGELFQVARDIGSSGINFDSDNEDDEEYETIGFRVFKLDRSEPRRWVEVKSLGDHTLFVGVNTSFFVLASDFPGCRGNCIYFTDNLFELHFTNRQGACDMGIFSLEDETIEPHYKSDDSQILVPPPIWIAPSYATGLLQRAMNPPRRYPQLMARLETLLQLQRKSPSFA